MANYCCALRTNYFHVKDPEAFRKFMERVAACEDAVSLWEEKDSDGRPVFMFCCYSPIMGIEPADAEENDDFEYDYEEFVHGLSDLVADDDAIIILESGNEKLRYVVGSALIITDKDSEYLDIAVIAVKSAAKMLGNPDWKTQVCY